MSNEKMIDVIMVEPMRPPGIVSMRDNTKAMQEAVGGEIEEYMPFDDDIAIVCNQEGKHSGLPLNRAIRDENGEIIDVIAGTFFIAYAPPESEEFLSMPEELSGKYMEKFRYPEKFFMGRQGIEAVRVNPERSGPER